MLFNPLASAEDIITVYNQALKEDPQLEKARENMSAILETQNQASANLFLPQANLTGNIGYDWQNVKFSGGQAIGISGRNNFLLSGYALNLTQPILHYDRIIQWQQADIRIAKAGAQLASAEIDLILKVATRYFGVLSAEENLGFAKAQQDSLMRKLKETELREAAGFLAFTDVQEAQAGYDHAVSDSIEAEQRLRDAQENLQEITGITYTVLAKMKEDIPLIEPDPKDEGQWIKQALDQNLSVKMYEFESQISKADIDVQKSGHFPTLDVNASHGFQSSGGRFGSVDQEDSAIGLTLNVPLYQGGQINSRTRQAEHRYKESLALLKETRRSVQKTTSQAFLGVTVGISRVKALQQTLKSSNSAILATEAGFRVGYRTPLDLIVAQREHLAVLRDYSRARYDYLLNTLKLKHSVGTLSSNDIAILDNWMIKAASK
jgi:outer membrane protein